MTCPYIGASDPVVSVDAIVFVVFIFEAETS